MIKFVALAFIFQIIFFLSVSCANSEPAKEMPLSGTKLICVWSIEAENPEAVEKGVEQAGSLGFNAVCWDRPGVVEACHKLGMQAFAIICPLERREGAQLQVLRPGEEKLPGFDRNSIPDEQYYQYGGEPAGERGEILDQNFTCPNDPGVAKYTLEQVENCRNAGFDGIIWDFVGYRNYRSCECAICREKFANFRARHPDMAEKEARGSFYEQVLVDLYNALYRETKALAPNLIIANHIHPVYLPDLFYWNKVKVDYCGVTVSWFFKPHWSLEKVKNYTKKVVSGPYVEKDVTGMPMIGFYADGQYARDRKSAQRLKQEFEILKEAGARHFIMCELGHILRDKEALKVVREELLNK